MSGLVGFFDEIFLDHVISQNIVKFLCEFRPV